MSKKSYFDQEDVNGQYQLSLVANHSDGSIWVSISSINDCPIEFDMGFTLPLFSVEKLKKALNNPIKD